MARKPSSSSRRISSSGTGQLRVVTGSLTVLIMLFNLHRITSFFGRPLCHISNWPSSRVVESWPFDGERERCFCAYSELEGRSDGARMNTLNAECPSWPRFVSTDRTTPDRVGHFGSATVLGRRQGNATSGRYGYVGDWALDLGSGFGEDCNRSLSPDCRAIGAHVLTIPSRRYLRDVRALGRFFHELTLAEGGRGGVVELCELLHDLIAGALTQVARLSRYDSCREENEDPTASRGCVAQCFHIEPDVFYLHLHTTAGVLRQRDGPVNSGLGPNYNASDAARRATHFGRYNLCVCEPASWAGAPGRGPSSGSCPEARPSESAYLYEASVALCRNLAGIEGIDPSHCNACANAAMPTHSAAA